jgi:REP-associated tyrosine transposase
MPLPKPHRKRVRHCDDLGEIHELTFSCYQRWPIFDDQWRREQFSIAVDRAMDNHNWRLAAFAYMPEHVHLLVYPISNGLKVHRLLFAIKRPFSFRVKQRLVDTADSLLSRLTIRQRPNRSTFRFWQEGPGYDRNIRTEKVLLSSIDYIHSNPVRRGLVERATDYRWSSARWYAADDQSTDLALPELTAIPLEWFCGSVDVTSY